MTAKSQLLAYESLIFHFMSTIAVMSSGPSVFLVRGDAERMTAEDMLTKLENYKDYMTSPLCTLAAGLEPSVPVPGADLSDLKARIKSVLIAKYGYRHEDRGTIFGVPVSFLDTAKLA